MIGGTLSRSVHELCPLRACMVLSRQEVSGFPDGGTRVRGISLIEFTFLEISVPRFKKKGNAMPKFAGVIGAGALALCVAGGASAQAERLTLGLFPGLAAAESFEILDR